MNKKWILLWTTLGLTALLVLGFFGYRWLTSSIVPEEPQVTRQEETEKIPAPDFTMTDQNGDLALLSDYFGMPIVLNFWASWCPPCQSEMPHFNEVYEEMKGEVMFIMLDCVDGQRETVETGRAFIEQKGYTFPVFFDTQDQEGAYTYGATALPSTLFIDREGNVVAGYQQAISEEFLRENIALIR